MAHLSERRITIVGINYAPESTGIAPYTTALARALSAAGAEVHVVTGLPHYPQWAVSDSRFAHGSFFDERDGDIRLTRCRHFVPSPPTVAGRLRMEASFLARAMRVVRHDRSDLVLTVTPSVAGLAAGVLGRRGRPVGTIVQDLTGNAACESGSARAWVGSAIRGVEHALLRRSSAVGVISPEFRRGLIGAGVADSCLVDVPNFTHIQPVDVSTAQARQHLGWSPDRFTLVHTGNMGAKQGLGSVVKAARLASERGVDVDFVLMGDGNQRALLAEAADGVAAIRLVPPVSAEDYPMVLAAADVLLVNELPGVREMSLPSKLTSYAASGKPILAAVDPSGITAQFLAGARLGHAVTAGEPETLLDSVQLLRSDPDLLEALAAASRRVYRTHYSKADAYLRYVAFAEQAGDFVKRIAVVPAPAVGRTPVPAARHSHENAMQWAL